MSLKLKNVTRKLLRTYLTYTPITKGRYPLMMALHKYLHEPITVQVKTMDRGIMILDLEDESQFTLYYNMYEWSYLRVINSLTENTNVVLDIGANIGQYALLFAKNANIVYAFEPSPAMLTSLRKHIELNNIQDKVKIIAKALSNKPGTLNLTIPSSNNSGQATTIIEKGSNLQTVAIDAITLDDFMDSEGKPNIDLIKMDIEGAELFALQGMKQTLASPHKPIVILEMFEKAMNTAGYSSIDIIQELQQYGYQPFQFLRSGKLQTLNLTGFVPYSENYCFLTNDHLQMQKVKRVLL